MHKILKFYTYDHFSLLYHPLRYTSVRHMSVTFDSTYIPRHVEENQDNYHYFEPKERAKETFVMLLPPPNITGTLHLGHALAVTIQDVLMRWNRMRGLQTLWIPGIDHAGIATQIIVEKKIWKERKQTRQDIGREQLIKEVLQWKTDKADIIVQQLKIMSASLDWSRQLFTLDPKQSYAVTEAFVRLYELGLIYQSDYLVNWSCILRTAISDIEVEHLDISGPTMISVPGYEKQVEFGVLTKFAYKVCDSDKEIIVATTRPETMLGDTAIAVHSSDERYTSFINQMCWHPFRNEKIPIICDDVVNSQFGTGAIKVTPGHSHVDFEIAKRHNLPLLQIIDEKGFVNCGQFKEIPRFDARGIILNELGKVQLLRSREAHQMVVPICSRSKDVVEFLLKPQWFLQCTDMAVKAVDAVKNGDLEIEPNDFIRDWNNWLGNIRDWCLSRQLWWGHRIPMYYCYAEDEKNETCYVAAHNLEEAKFKASRKLMRLSENIIAKQSEDVLDTWFSSALLPLSAFGWPAQNELQQYYPLTLMETGHDILFFWVARMVILGTALTGKLPFPKVLLHGIIRDGEGKKMSKSLGNVIAPEDIIFGTSLEELQNKLLNSYSTGVLSQEELQKALLSHKKMFPEGIPDCGSDALRFTLCTHNIKNHYINFNVQECKLNKFFCNKLWQATKFTNKWMGSLSSEQKMEKVEYKDLDKMDKWILSRLSYMVDTVNANIQKYDFHVATSALKNYLYYEFCDTYLETTKRELRLMNSSKAKNHCWALSTCLDIGLRSLNPFMPRVTKHLHERLLTFSFNHQQLGFPKNLPWRDINTEAEVNTVIEIVISIRRLMKMLNVSKQHKPKVVLAPYLPLLVEFLEVMEVLSRCDKIIVANEVKFSFTEAASVNVGNNVTVNLLIPPELKHSLEINLQSLEKKKDKVTKNLKKLQNMMSTEGYLSNASVQARNNNEKKVIALEEDLTRIEFMQKLSKSYYCK